MTDPETGPALRASVTGATLHDRQSHHTCHEQSSESGSNRDARTQAK
mgnify:CR=1 FL=1